MKDIEDISEDQMVATFLKGEITSPKFGKCILDKLKSDGRSRAIVDRPNNADASENLYRKELLGHCRGFGMNTQLFEGFPKSVKWKRIEFDIDDLQKIKYLNYFGWVNISGGTRVVADGAKRIAEGKSGVDKTPFRNLVEAINRGESFQEPILVTGNGTDFIVLEGNHRFTSFLMIGGGMPETITAIVGFSDEMNAWRYY